MSDYLIHYGVKGMKWGVRKQRPLSSTESHSRNKNDKKRGSTAKKIAIGAAIVGGTILAAYGAKKLHSKDVARRVAKVKAEMEAYESRNSRHFSGLESTLKMHPGANKSSAYKTAEKIHNQGVLDAMRYENSLYDKYHLKKMKYGSGRAYTAQQLNAMGIKTFEPERVDVKRTRWK